MSATTKHATLAGLSLHDYTPVEGLSDETTAFSGVVYEEEAGKRIGSLTNDGRGGCHLFRPDSAEGHKRWEEANREFVPVPWKGGKFDGGGEWGLDDALTMLSETVLNLMSEYSEGETKFIAATPRTAVTDAALPVLTVDLRPGEKSGAGLWRLATECHADYGTLVFGMPSAKKTGGVNAFVTEAVADEGERQTSSIEGMSNVR